MMPIRTLVFVLALLPAAAWPAEPPGALPEILQGLGLEPSAIASRELPGWAPPSRVVVNNVLGQDLAGRLQGEVPGVEFLGATSAEQAADLVAGAQVLVGFCDQALFDKADSLHWVQVYWAGVEHCVDTPAMQSGALLLSNGQRLSSPTIAEHVMAMMFALSRGFPAYMDQQANGQWQPRRTNAVAGVGDLQGRTVLVVGLGGIGTQVASRAHAMGMRVLATRGSRREGPAFIEYVGLAHEAPGLAVEADVVVNALPLTDGTRDMIDRQFFAKMKPTAFYINVGRGGTTVTADLLAALQEGVIAGAGLDVTDPEPLPAGHPLWDAPNVIITPHVAAQSQQTMMRILALVEENVKRYVAGEPLLSVVDIERGY